MRNFAPQTRQFNERKITRRQESFEDGVLNDLAGSKVPITGLFWAVNYDVHPDRLESRAGNKVWSNTTLPALSGRTGYSLTKSGTTVTKTVGTDFTSADVGSYIVYDDGIHERIDTYVSATQVTVKETDTHSASTAAWIRGKVHLIKQHKYTGKILLHIDTRLFIASDSSISSWTEATIVTHRYTGAILSPYLRSSESTYDEKNNYAYIYNAGGIFKVEMDSDPIIYFPINTLNPKIPMTAGIAKTTSLKYGKRVVYRMARLSSHEEYQMNDSGISVEQVSGTNSVNSNYQDYTEYWTARPTGDGSTTYGVLTGDTLVSPYDVYTGWTGISNGQFKITINSTERNVSCNFTGVTSMQQVAGVIQLALRDYFSGVTCEYSTDHFVITDPAEGSTVGYTSAGDGGTDIGSSIMKCESGTGASSTPAYTESVIIGEMRNPNVFFGDDTYQLTHWTHYQVFSTLDIGENGIDPTTGKGNNKVLYVWAGDYPIMKAFTASMSLAVVTASIGTFSEYDVGDTIRFEDGSTYTIVSYTNTSTVVTSGVGISKSSQGASLGGTVVFTASQSGTTVTSTTSVFDSGEFIGQTIYFSDDSKAYITGYISGTQVTVAQSQTVASQGAATSPGVRSVTLNINDDELRTRSAGFSLENRLWEPLPNCDIGVIVNAFMYGAIRGENKLYYSQMPAQQEYYAGYYRNDQQVASFRDTVQHLSEFPDRLIIFCSRSTHAVAINTYNEVTIPQIGETVYVIAGQYVVDHSVGIISWGMYQEVDKGRARVITSEPAYREFNGYQYSDNLMEGRLMKKIKKLISSGSSIYSKERGHLVYGADDTSVYKTTKCYRIAVLPDQGVGPSEYTGTDWPFPEPNTGTINILDSNNNQRSLILSSKYGLFHDISTRDGSTGASLTKVWLDKVATDGTGGTDIVPYFLPGEDRGGFEHYFIRHLESHIYVRPYSESDGFLSGIQFDISIYEDGEPSTASATTVNVPYNGDICFDKIVEAHRLQLKFSANKSKHIVSGRQQYYVAHDRAAAPDNRLSTEHDYQEEFATPLLWIWTKNGVPSDLAYQATLSLSDVSSATGVDDVSGSAIGFSTTQIITSSASFSGTGTLIFWRKGSMDLFLDSEPVVLNSTNTYNGWTLGYATGLNGSGILEFVPWGTAYIYDLRLFSTDLSIGAITYYFNDVSTNSGNVMLIK